MKYVIVEVWENGERKINQRIDLQKVDQITCWTIFLWIAGALSAVGKAIS